MKRIFLSGVLMLVSIGSTYSGGFDGIHQIGNSKDEVLQDLRILKSSLYRLRNELEQCGADGLTLMYGRLFQQAVDRIIIEVRQSESRRDLNSAIEEGMSTRRQFREDLQASAIYRNRRVRELFRIAHDDANVALQESVRYARELDQGELDRNGYVCVAVSLGREEHGDGYMGRGATESSAIQAALNACYDYHDRCEITQCNREITGFIR